MSSSLATRLAVSGTVGESTKRPDGAPKTRGEFAFASDLWAEGCLFGRTLRSPHPSARITSLDLRAAQAIEGVRAIVTAADVPGLPGFGLETPDQPVFASEVVRHEGEPIAAVAAVHPEIARQAAEAIVVSYEPLPGLYDCEAAITAAPIHPDGNVFRHLVIEKGDPAARGEVVVEGSYEVGMQDQAFMGPEAGMAVPSGDGGVELYVSTQWIHRDAEQVAACLGLPEERVRINLAGVGGAFGAREDISLQIHLCLLALKTNSPVKMVYDRAESFHAHVHRHPARIFMRHHATAAGRLVKVEARIVLDGGAYMSTSAAVIGTAATFAPGPYEVPNVSVDAYSVRTNNPPCGAMRGFGAVQSCFAYEAQMDALAAACGLGPVELRLKNALASGGTLATGQVIDGALPVRRCIEETASLPLPLERPDDFTARPGGAGRTSGRRQVRRGVGYAVGIKNIGYSEGSKDYSTASCRLEDGMAVVSCAAAEVGQGFVTIALQIARTVLGTERVALATPGTTEIGSAGSSSASRQTWMSGGAVKAACESVAGKLLAHVGRELGRERLELKEGRIVSVDGEVDLPIEEAAPGVVFEATERYDTPGSEPLDAKGQGRAHVSFAVACHRAIVDVDQELGLVRVVQIATAQDVGKALNPLSVTGQIEGGIAQGVGLAVMEEILVREGRVANPSFTDYLIPTALDMPDVVSRLVEEPEPGAPFGAKGVGEAPTVSSHAAVVAAIRDATGLDLRRCPVRPQDISGGRLLVSS